MTGIIIGSIALVVAVVALSLAVTVTRRIGARDPVGVPPFWRKVLRIQQGPSSKVDLFLVPPEKRERIAFIVNPTKQGVDLMREQALRACAIHYMPEPMWLYTTVEDPGTEIAKSAVEAGATMLVAVGGDGTVRAVAEAAATTGVTMGILPMGTGNILARNLDLPLGDTTAMIRTLLEGADTAVDVGWLELGRGPRGVPDNERHIFLVIAGAGLDAEMVAGADEGLKKRLGWMAYFFAAMKHMGEKRMEVSVSVDGGESVDSHMRTVLMANCGKLPGGIQLIPDASFTDGQLDVATIDARGGIVGWTDLFGTVVGQTAGIKQPEALKAWRASRIDHVRGASVELRFTAPQKVQVDGESLGRAMTVTATVDAGALTVRTPAVAAVKDDEKDKASK